jgi:hypothetical protein
MTCHSSNDEIDFTTWARTWSNIVPKMNENMMHYVECMQALKIQNQVILCLQKAPWVVH